MGIIEDISRMGLKLMQRLYGVSGVGRLSTSVKFVGISVGRVIAHIDVGLMEGIFYETQFDAEGFLGLFIGDCWKFKFDIDRLYSWEMYIEAAEEDGTGFKIVLAVELEFDGGGQLE